MLRVLLITLLPSLVFAQGADVCEPASAQSLLDIGNVRASVFANGSLFYDGDETLYEVPNGSGTHSQYAAGLWIGGTVDGETRFRGSRYDRNEFWPGPLTAEGTASADLCAAYDRIWRVSIHDVAAYNETGVATDDLAEWPAEAGAPVVDGDGDPTNYDLAAGDRPAILGEQTAWWVMNDQGGAPRWSQGPAVGLEVRVMAFAMSGSYASDRYDDAATGAAADVATFYRYEVTYRGEEPLEATRIGLFDDADLGYFSDDFLGGDGSRTMGYVYNGDDMDESTSGLAGYGATPPALGVRLLGAAPEDVCITQVIGSDSVPVGAPSDGEEAYDRLGCIWKDGSPQTTGGLGLNTGDPTRVLYSAMPPAFWSEENVDGNGLRHIPSDRRLVLGREMGTLQPGETVTFDVVMPWAQSDAGRFESIAALQAASDRLAALPFEPDPRLQTILPSAGEPLPETDPLALRVGPNPAQETTTLRFALAEPAGVRVRVVDVLGREVARVHDGPLSATSHVFTLATADWAPGVYLAHVETEGRSQTRSFVVAR